MTTNVSATPVYSGKNPPEGPCVVPIRYDWSIVGTSPNQTTLNNLQNSTKLTGVKCLFVDNSTNDAPVSIAIIETAQKITLAAGYQGYFPVLVTSRATFIVSSTSTLQSSNIGYMNFHESYGIWPAYGTPASSSTPIPVSDVILDACVVNSRLNVRSIDAQATDVSRSGLITLGGTAQVLMAANVNRRGWRVQNNDVNFPAEEIWLSTTGTAAVNGNASFSLAAYGAVGYPGGSAEGVGSNAISIIAATTGHKFYAIEW